MAQSKKSWFYQNGVKWYELAHHFQTLWADNIHRKAVAKEMGAIGRGRILDLGTGTGLTAIKTSLECPNCCIVGVDVSETILGKARRNIQHYGLKDRIKMVRAELEALPFESNSFNGITSCYGFGGIKDSRKVFRELARVAAPDAIICVAEMIEPPSEYPIRRFIHNRFVEPWINFFWDFQDLDLLALFEENNIKVIQNIYFTNRLLGSARLVKGVIKK